MSQGRFVVKRDGRKEKWSFDKITRRIAILAEGLPNTEPELITQRVSGSLKNNITTVEIDILSAEIADNLISYHPEYRQLAGRILVSNNHKNTSDSFSKTMEELNSNVDEKGESFELFSTAFMAFVRRYSIQLDNAIQHTNDFNFNYVQYKVFEDTYAIKKRLYVPVERYVILERPQYLWMREAIQVNGYNDIDRVLQVYSNISHGYYTHATPTILNSGFTFNSCISCYLDIPRDDSITEIYKLNERCAMHSKGAGGIGFDVSNVRAKGSGIRKSGGRSNGLVPMLKVFEATANYVDQCFHPTTRVLTINGYRAIETLQENDRVLTHDGSFQPITKILNNVLRGDQVLLQFQLNTGNLQSKVLLTKNHPLYVLHNRAGLSHGAIVEQLDSKRVEPEYIESEKVLRGDYIAIPVPQLSFPQESLSNDDLELYIMLLLDQFVINEDFSVLHYRGSDHRQFLEQYIKKNFLEHSIDDSSIKIYPNHHFKFTKAMLFQGSTRYIHSKLLHCSLEQVEVMMKKLLQIAGFKPIVRSLEIAEGIYYWAMRLGVLCDYTPHNEFSRNSFGNAGSKYIIYLPPNFWDLSKAATYSSKYHFKHNGYFYSQIVQIEEGHYQGAVYDLKINKNHNYTTELGLVHNGGGKRRGSFAVYLEPWHADVLDVNEAMGVQGDERKLCRDLFYAIWMNDLFMERLEKNEMWSLMCPNKCPGLYNVYGDEFKRLYERYEAEKRYSMQIPAKELYMKFVKLQLERGRPYIVFKDWSNAASNQQNIGIIRSSNLCAEILEVANDEYTACCNLASIALPRFVRADGSFNFSALVEIAKEVAINLNHVIDHNYYMTEETERSNKELRPIAIGVQGLADVFAMLRLPFASKEAIALDAKIYEHIYYGALQATIELSKLHGPYKRFEGSPFSKGILQFDYYNNVRLSPELDWKQLKKDLVQYGARNSLLTASMPTASTSILLGNNECFEPYPSLLIAKSNKTGRFLLLNKYFVECMEERGLWNADTFELLKQNEGFIGHIGSIPQDIRDLFTTSYEIKQKVILDHAIARQPFIDQSQSMNLFFSRNRLAQQYPDRNADAVLVENMYKSLLYAWKNKLKTGVYYTRTEAATTAQKRPAAPQQPKKQQMECTDDICTSCSA